MGLFGEKKVWTVLKRVRKNDVIVSAQILKVCATFAEASGEVFRDSMYEGILIRFGTQPSHERHAVFYTETKKDKTLEYLIEEYLV